MYVVEEHLLVRKGYTSRHRVVQVQTGPVVTENGGREAPLLGQGVGLPNLAAVA
jgi:hypothetical protein